MNILRLVLLLLALGATGASLSGCAFGAGAVTGAVATEALHEEGYELESPIEEEDEDE